MTKARFMPALTAALALAAVPASGQQHPSDAIVPDRPRPPAVVIGGGVEATIRLLNVPTQGGLHSVLVARDGSIWYAAETANRLGRVDPATGAVREFPLKAPQSGPRGLAEDRDGNVWYAANGAIGKLDPRSGAVTEHRMPDPAAQRPEALAIDGDGIVWFTLPGVGSVGRLDPASGKLKVVAVPPPRSRPYGLAIGANNVPVLALSGINRIAAVDRQTMAISMYGLPNSAARPMGLAIGPDGTVWYTDFARGFLGRLNLATGAHKEWLSPSGARSQPYGIVFAHGAVWYVESFAKPNTMVRVDPKRETFQTWEIPDDAGIARNMAAANDGTVIVISLTNQVGLIELARTVR